MRSVCPIAPVVDVGKHAGIIGAWAGSAWVGWENWFGQGFGWVGASLFCWGPERFRWLRSVGNMAALTGALTVGSFAALGATDARLMAETFDLTRPGLQSEIWSDKVPSLLKYRRYLQSLKTGKPLELTGLVYTNDIKVAGREYVVSVLNDQCGSTTLDNSISCAARVVEIVNGKPVLVREIPDFFVSFVPDTSGLGTNAQSRYENLVSVNSATKTMVFTTIYDGKPEQGLSVPLK
jgi:hypothetical protein